MRRGGLTTLLSAGLLAFVARAGTGTGAQPGERDLAAAWMKREAVPLRLDAPEGFDGDFGFLRQFVGGAHVVSFGEAMHGSHELYLLRNRLFAYLVDRLGFTAIALETGFADSIAADDYVHGKGAMTHEMVAGLFSYGGSEAGVENQQLIEWIRAHNARPGVRHEVSVYGIDMEGEYRQPQARVVARKSLDFALNYIDSVAPVTAQELRRRLEPLLVRIGGSNRYEDLPLADRDTLSAAIGDVVSSFERRHVEWVAASSSLAYHRGYRNALNARLLDADRRASGYSLGMSGDINQRDATLAANVEWALGREGPLGRIFLFAFDGHTRKGPQISGEPRFTSAGQHLQEVLGSDLRAIGSVYESMEDSGRSANSGLRVTAGGEASLPRMLGEPGGAAFFLDLRHLPTAGPVRDWWSAPRQFGMAGATNELRATECFDALLFVAKITRAHTLPAAAAP